MNTDAEIKLRLVITDFSCAPALISELLSIEPSRTWLEGDLVVSQGTRRHKENGWLLEFLQHEAGETPSQLLDRLLAVVIPNMDKFEHLPSGSEVQMSTIIYMHGGTPELNFSVTQIKSLAKINASVDVDLYLA